MALQPMVARNNIVFVITIEDIAIIFGALLAIDIVCLFIGKQKEQGCYMILFRKRTIRLVPFYLLYMAAVLAASSLYELYAAESGEIVAQVFGDRVYCYLLVPPFIWTISTIDGSTKKPSFIRMKSRNQYLLFLLLQQYLFAVIYLTTWFSMIYLLAIWHGETYSFLDISLIHTVSTQFFPISKHFRNAKRTKIRCHRQCLISASFVYSIDEQVIQSVLRTETG